MVLIKVPTFVETRPWIYVGFAISVSLIISASVFTFSFFLRDFFFEILRRWDYYDIRFPENFSTSRMFIVHIAIMLIILIYVLILFLLLRWVFIESNIKESSKKK